jgi:deoxyribose-phosphate aldolase
MSNSTREIKVIEASAAAQAGGKAIDMTIDIGKTLSGDWNYVMEEIWQINEAVVSHGAILKVIFGNDYFQEDHIIRHCKICTDLKVAFVKFRVISGFAYRDQSVLCAKQSTGYKARRPMSSRTVDI